MMKRIKANTSTIGISCNVGPLTPSQYFSQADLFNVVKRQWACTVTTPPYCGFHSTTAIGLETIMGIWAYVTCQHTVMLWCSFQSSFYCGVGHYRVLHAHQLFTDHTYLLSYHLIADTCIDKCQRCLVYIKKLFQKLKSNLKILIPKFYRSWTGNTSTQPTCVFILRYINTWWYHWSDL